MYSLKHECFLWFIIESSWIIAIHLVLNADVEVLDLRI
jgi:hypothetical protein